MSLSIVATPSGIDINVENGGGFSIDLISKDGSLEFYADNGGYDDDNRWAVARISREDAPEALMAIQNWIESMAQEVTR